MTPHPTPLLVYRGQSIYPSIHLSCEKYFYQYNWKKKLFTKWRFDTVSTSEDKVTTGFGTVYKVSDIKPEIFWVLFIYVCFTFRLSVLSFLTGWQSVCLCFNYTGVECGRLFIHCTNSNFRSGKLEIILLTKLSSSPLSIHQIKSDFPPN